MMKLIWSVIESESWVVVPVVGKIVLIDSVMMKLIWSVIESESVVCFETGSDVVVIEDDSVDVSLLESIRVDVRLDDSVDVSLLESIRVDVRLDGITCIDSFTN